MADDDFDIDIYGDVNEEEVIAAPARKEEEVKSEEVEASNGISEHNNYNDEKLEGGKDEYTNPKLESEDIKPEEMEGQQQIKSTDESSHEIVSIPKQAPQQQGVKRKEGSDERPVDAGATTAILISDLHWWNTDDDVRGWINQAQCEDELKEITFSEHKVNGKSKGQAYVEFSSQQAATAAKNKIDAFGSGQQYVKKHTVSYSNPNVNPFKTLPKDAPARVGKDAPINRSVSGGFENRGGGNFGNNNFRGRGGYNANRGGMNNMGGGFNRNFSGAGMNNRGGFQGGQMGAGFQGNNMGGGFGGFNNGMMNGMRGGAGGMRGRGGMANGMGNGMMGMPMGGMAMGNMGGMGGMGGPMMGGGMPGMMTSQDYNAYLSSLSLFFAKEQTRSPVTSQESKPHGVDNQVRRAKRGRSPVPSQIQVLRGQSLQDITPLHWSSGAKQTQQYTGAGFQGMQPHFNPAFFQQQQQGQGAAGGDWQNPHGAKRARPE